MKGFLGRREKAGGRARIRVIFILLCDLVKGSLGNIFFSPPKDTCASGEHSLVLGSQKQGNEKICLHWGGVKATAKLFWPFPRVNSQEKEPYSLLQDGSSGFSPFIPMSTGAGGALRMSCDSKSFGGSSPLRSIGSSPWWKWSWRVRWNCEHFAWTSWSREEHWWSHEILSGSFCYAWDSTHRTKGSRHCSVRMRGMGGTSINLVAKCALPQPLVPAFGKIVGFYWDTV